MTSPNKYIGSSFDDFLRTEGLLEEAEAVAQSRVNIWKASQRNLLTSSHSRKNPSATSHSKTLKT